MALANYSDLKAAVASYLARSDLTSQIPDFITLAEKKVARRLNFGLRETTASVTTSAGGTVAMPSDYSQMRAVLYNNKPLNNIPVEAANAYSTTGGVPIGFSIVGQTLYVWPAQAVTVTLFYHQEFTALSDASPTNWLMTDAPDLYLYGALLEAHAFIRDDDRLPIWKQAFEEALDALRDQELAAKQPAAAYIVIGETP